MPITVGHMISVKVKLEAIEKKRTEGLHVKQTQCTEDTTDDVATLLAFVNQRIEEA